MSNYVGISLEFTCPEDAGRAAACARKIEDELYHDGTKVTFELSKDHKGKDILCFNSLSTRQEEIDIAFEIANRIAASLPEISMRLYMTWEGPVAMEAISRNGRLYELERVRDENGYFLVDEDENARLIEPADWGFYEIRDGMGIIPVGTSRVDEFGFWRSRLKSVVIPPSVKEIGRFAFARCQGLESVVIPDSVISIGEGAFEGCTGLESIKIPDSVKEIGMAAFEGCSRLASVVLPASLGVIAPFTFGECTSLTDIKIPESVSLVGRCAFSECPDVSIPESATVHREWYPNCPDSDIKDDELPF